MSFDPVKLKVRGWRKTGRPKHVNPSFTELKSVRCFIHGPELEDVYKIAEMSKSSTGDKNVAFTSSLLKGGMKSGTRSELVDEAMEEIYDKQYTCATDDEIMIEESDPYSYEPEESYNLESGGMSKAFVGPALEKLARPYEKEVEPGYKSGKEDEPRYESEKDEGYQRWLRNKKSACSVM
ncbi:hypothetical protein L1987_87614 [Smallanthus sonchifolius]|nr:hypothetical protein L1987_87614 [Smallanthus sonchifolius]